jgi:hypothetical protein
MNVRPIEMQIAIPRTPDASQMAHQQMERPVFEQTLAQQQRLKEASEQLQKTAKLDKAEQAVIRDEEREGSPGQQHGGKRRPKEKEPPRNRAGEAQHPYKGRHIDLSL